MSPYIRCHHNDTCTTTLALFPFEFSKPVHYSKNFNFTTITRFEDAVNLDDTLVWSTDNITGEGLDVLV